MKRCLEIAKQGLGTTRPNPMVGCVIVSNNEIIGEGYTSKYGSNHAEVNAINSVKNKALLKHATLYVTLEPCSHYGKTPPCCDLIIKHNISNIVIGCIDDNVEVAGKGIRKLKKANIKITLGVLEAECKTHHKRFFTYHNKKRPFIILKWAETRNGFIAPKAKNKKQPIWITNKYSRQLVHKWRAEEQAILVGAGTVREDNPTLTVRTWTGNNPIRLIIDKENKLVKDYTIFNKQAETIVLSENNIDFTEKIENQICNLLFDNNITSVIIEGGAKTIQTFINANLWDEARVFIGQNSFKEGIKAPYFSGKLVSEEKIESDILKVFENR